MSSHLSCAHTLYLLGKRLNQGRCGAHATTARSRGWCDQRVYLCAPDQKPQHDRHLSEERGKAAAKGEVVVLR